MAFVDELTLQLKAGGGGDGVVRWRREKGRAKAGPSGGNGGKGGSIYARAVSDIGILSAYKKTKAFEAKDGKPGSRNSRQGADGEDLEIKFPVGSRITNLSTGHVIELLETGGKERLLKGGRGGLGNEYFKSSTNVAPREATRGEAGEEALFKIELLLIVDVGIIGLPNAGKSSLLNSLTSARSKVGSFPFTTLEPALGMFNNLVLADIPGLIEGASEGRGLGHKFLRHIERTKRLLHSVSAEEPDPLEAYRIVRNELELYNKAITLKPEVVVLTKVDLVPQAEAERKLKMLKSVSANVVPVSILDDKLVANLKKCLITD